ncbi:MAG TPA: sugar ABC transporter permease [Rectinemataceae bacterium]
MVQKKSTRRIAFLAFVAPAFVLYALFFLLPFGQGLRISFTNWDGLTPKTPISMDKDEFETQVLSHLGPGADRDFVLSLYSLDASGRYSRQGLGGLERYRLERVLRKAGYSPDSYRDVGLANYKAIFSGEVDARFYPRRYEERYFNPNSDLPASVEAGSYRKDFLDKLEGDSAALAATFYVADGTEYTLLPGRDEFEAVDPLYSLKALEEGRLESSAVDGFVTALKKAGLAQDGQARDAALASFVSSNSLEAEDEDVASKAAQAIYEIGEFKSLLGSTWKAKKLDLGVVGFTLFFALGNVVFANLLAFWLAMALDRKLKTKNVLRSVFFLPNVLSMIVVALIWSFIFFHLLPRITGIQTWMSDSAKAPWLLVLVSVWQASGYFMVVYLAGLQNIPQEVLEAAVIDGASPWDRLRHVTLPLLAPAFTVCVFLSIANALKCFDLVYAMVGPSGYAVGTVPFVMDIFFDAFARKLAGLATAKATLLFVAILLITGLQLYFMKRKEVQL